MLGPRRPAARAATTTRQCPLKRAASAKVPTPELTTNTPTREEPAPKTKLCVVGRVSRRVVLGFVFAARQNRNACGLLSDPSPGIHPSRVQSVLLLCLHCLDGLQQGQGRRFD
mmetsp:Transcript_64672/g.150402  ORF Transcript_64672/g.150402 Transcript_64672/m.150402 type:complete len:113 (-) Transcript_64672:521-859(-)